MAAVVKEIELSEPPKDGVSNLVFSPTGHLLLASSWDCSVRVYDTTSNSLSHLSYSKAPVLDSCFGGENSTVFSAGLDREVTMLDVTTGTKRRVGAHSESIKSLLYSQNHRACQHGRVAFVGSPLLNHSPTCPRPGDLWVLGPHVFDVGPPRAPRCWRCGHSGVPWQGVRDGLVWR